MMPCQSKTVIGSGLPIRMVSEHGQDEVCLSGRDVRLHAVREGAQWREEPLLPPQERRGGLRWAEVMRQPLLRSAPALGKAAHRPDREPGLRTEPPWPSWS